MYSGGRTFPHSRMVNVFLAFRGTNQCSVFFSFFLQVSGIFSSIPHSTVSRISNQSVKLPNELQSSIGGVFLYIKQRVCLCLDVCFFLREIRKKKLSRTERERQRKARISRACFLQMFDSIINTENDKGSTKKRYRSKHCSGKTSYSSPSFASIRFDLVDLTFHELTKEQVKQALSSLITTLPAAPSSSSSSSHRKRGRPKSHHRAVEEDEEQQPTKKHKPMIYNQVVPSPRTEAPETIVLATSGLTSKQIVRLSPFSLLCSPFSPVFFFQI